MLIVQNCGPQLEDTSRSTIRASRVEGVNVQDAEMGAVDRRMCEKRGVTGFDSLEQDGGCCDGSYR